MRKMSMSSAEKERAMVLEEVYVSCWWWMCGRLRHGDMKVESDPARRTIGGGDHLVASCGRAHRRTCWTCWRYS